MKIGVFTVLYQHLPLETALDKIAALGVEAVEISTGNYAGSTHCDVQSLLGDGDSLRRFKDAIESRGLVISGLSQHGNPLHPQEDVARATHETWRATVQLAERLEVPVVLAFSGCPRRQRRGDVSELGDVPVARRLPRNPRLAVERERPAVLDPRSQVCA